MSVDETGKRFCRGGCQRFLPPIDDYFERYTDARTGKVYRRHTCRDCWKGVRIAATQRYKKRHTEALLANRRMRYHRDKFKKVMGKLK